MRRLFQGDQIKDSGASSVLLQIAGVSERDIDLLLLEEFTASHAFARWFLEKVLVNAPANLKVARAQHSVTQSVGESDLLIAFSDKRGGTHYLLIENKIAAGFQPRQAARYQERGRKDQAKGLCKTFTTVLVAPAVYLGTTTSRRGFGAVLRYEDILAWFAGQRTLGPRATYKQALLGSAINKARFGYQPVEDAPVTDFWQSYWRLALEVAPELEMSEPRSKPSRAGFIYFRPGALPHGVSIVHKLRHGLLDLQFANLGRNLSKIREEFGAALLPGMKIERAAKSGVIRQTVPVFDTGRPFPEQATTARACIERAAALLRWYQQATNASGLGSSPGAQLMPTRGGT